jgi:hypothetical protein
VIGHDDEVVNYDLSGAHISPKNFDEKICHAFGLKERSSARCPGSCKKRSGTSNGTAWDRRP